MDPYVLKIKHGGALRRLTLPAGDELVFSYAQLQSRARDLFRLQATAPVDFTYVDKDGDVVGLADDQDLEDALVFQALNPLRITMVGGDSGAGSQAVKEESEQSRKEDSEIAPERPAQVIANVGQNIGSSPSIGTKQAEVVPIVEQSETTNAATSEEQPETVISSEQNDREIPSLAEEQPEVRPIPKQSTSRDDEVTSSQVSSQSLADSYPASDDGAAEDAIANKKIPSSPSLSTVEIVNANSDASNVASEDSPTDKSVGDGDPDGKGEEEHGKKQAVSTSGDGDSESNNVHRGIQCDGCGMIPITGPRFKSCRKSNYDLCLGCFDARDEAEQGEYVEINRRFYRLVHPTFDRRSLSSAFSLRKSGGSIPREDDSSEQSRQVIHCGVQCDECGIMPIEGPRFKSCKRFNYDLCLRCYERSGSDDEEYYRLDGPVASGAYLPIMNKIIRLAVPYYKLASLCERWVWILNPWTVVVDQATMKSLVAAPNSGPDTTENVKAGTEAVASGTSSSDAPALGIGTQAPQSDSFAREKAGYIPENHDSEEAIVYTFSENELAEVEALDAPTTGNLLPENRDSEEAAVFTFTEQELAGVEALNAPESNSYQEVHSAEMKDSSPSVTPDGSQEIAREPESAYDMKVHDLGEPTLDSTLETVVSEKRDVVPAEVPMTTTLTGEDAPPTVTDSGDEFSGSGSWQSAESGNSNSDPLSANLRAPTVEENLSSPLDALVAKLEGMGFTDQVLNKELLEKHNLDLRSTVDDLCAAEEWDPMLGDLQEMGFYDENMNRRLLIKNQGSLKPVVKELVRLAKGEGQE